MQFSECKGCTFKDNLLPITDQSFMNHLDEMIVVVDWDNEKIFEGFEHEETESSKKCELLKESRKDDLNFILSNNLNFDQKIHKTCSNDRCKSK